MAKKKFSFLIRRKSLFIQTARRLATHADFIVIFLFIQIFLSHQESVFPDGVVVKEHVDGRKEIFNGGSSAK